MYSTEQEDLFSGQMSFNKKMTENFPLCWGEINLHGFQTGWKHITGRPQHGNQNPNWKDCLDFVARSIENEVHLQGTCPDLPVTNKLPNRRYEFSREEYWHHMLALCEFYKESVKVNGCAKRDGTIAAGYSEVGV